MTRRLVRVYELTREFDNHGIRYNKLFRNITFMFVLQFYVVELWCFLYFFTFMLGVESEFIVSLNELITLY